MKFLPISLLLSTLTTISNYPLLLLYSNTTHSVIFRFYCSLVKPHRFLLLLRSDLTAAFSSSSSSSSSLSTISIALFTVSIFAIGSSSAHFVSQHAGAFPRGLPHARSPVIDRPIDSLPITTARKRHWREKFVLLYIRDTSAHDVCR